MCSRAILCVQTLATRGNPEEGLSSPLVLHISLVNKSPNATMTSVILSVHVGFCAHVNAVRSSGLYETLCFGERNAVV